MKKYVENKIIRNTKELTRVQEIKEQLSFNAHAEITNSNESNKHFEKVIKEAKKKLKLNLTSFEKKTLIDIIEQASLLLSYKETDYSRYKNISLSDLGEIRLIKQVKKSEKYNKYTPNDNAIYIPKIGTQNCVMHTSEMMMKHHNYYELEIKSLNIERMYLVNYLNSGLGKLFLKECDSGFVIPSKKITLIRKLLVPVPPLKIQKKIADTILKLEKINTSINNFKSSLSIKPVTSKNIIEKIDKLAEILDEITNVDKIKALCRNGETETVEFKSTVSLCLRRQTKEKDIEHEIIKTIIGFMNKKGGNLLVGVADDGEIIGLNDEIQKFHKESDDKFKQYFFNKLLKTHLSADNFGSITYTLIDIEEKKVLLVECKAATRPVYEKVDEDFYLRTDPLTIKLSGPELNEYIQKRFYP